jgi:hypothetical protein
MMAQFFLCSCTNDKMFAVATVTTWATKADYIRQRPSATTLSIIALKFDYCNAEFCVFNDTLSVMVQISNALE